MAKTKFRIEVQVDREPTDDEYYLLHRVVLRMTEACKFKKIAVQVFEGRREIVHPDPNYFLQNYEEPEQDEQEFDGDEGQDREAYTDEQDRESYEVDPALEGGESFANQDVQAFVKPKS